MNQVIQFVVSSTQPDHTDNLPHKHCSLLSGLSTFIDSKQYSFNSQIRQLIMEIDQDKNTEGEIIDLEDDNRSDNKKQYRYRRVYDSVRQNSCFNKKKWSYLLHWIMTATLILLFVITYFKVICTVHF